MSDPQAGAWSNEAIARGYKSALALPLDNGGRVFGALTIYSSDEVAFDASELTLLRELAEDLAFGIQALRTRINQGLAEQALLESQSKLVMAMDMAGLAHWEMDVASGLFTFDERMFSQLGTTSAREGGLTIAADEYIRKFVPPDDRRFVREFAARAEEAVDRRYNAQMEHRIARVDGSIGVVQVRALFEKDAAGHVVRVIGANLDITERKRAAAEVVAMNERYARQEAAFTTLMRRYASAPDDFTPIVRDVTEVVGRTLEVAQVSVWRHDDRGTSTRCLDLFQWPDSQHSSGMELTEEACPAFFTSLASSDVIAAHDAQNDTRTIELVTEHLKPYRITSMMSMAIRSQGATVGVLSCSHTGAPRRWTPDEQTFAIAVANFLSAITAQVERQRLEQQLRQAQKLEAIGQLAGGVAHDFNNILTVILGRAEEVSIDARLPGDLRDAVGDIFQSAERASALTRQLLTFSRRHTIQVRDVDMNVVVGNLTRMLERILGEDVVVEFRYASQSAYVRADPGMIEQVLLNLAVNARDAMPLWRSVVDRDVGTRSTRGPERPGEAAGYLGLPAGERHRLGHHLRQSPAHLRAVFHHEGRRQGDRTRSGDELRHRAAARRMDRGRESRRARNDVPRLLSARVCDGCRSACGRAFTVSARRRDDSRRRGRRGRPCAGHQGARAAWVSHSAGVERPEGARGVARARPRHRHVDHRHRDARRYERHPAGGAAAEK
jgi:GAF domain-containing protein